MPAEGARRGRTGDATPASDAMCLPRSARHRRSSWFDTGSVMLSHQPLRHSLCVQPGRRLWAPCIALDGCLRMYVGDYADYNSTKPFPSKAQQGIMEAEGVAVAHAAGSGGGGVCVCVCVWTE